VSWGGFPICAGGCKEEHGSLDEVMMVAALKLAFLRQMQESTATLAVGAEVHHAKGVY